jgi:hypothetical protein
MFYRDLIMLQVPCEDLKKKKKKKKKKKLNHIYLGENWKAKKKDIF